MQIGKKDKIREPYLSWEASRGGDGGRGRWVSGEQQRASPGVSSGASSRAGAAKGELGSKRSRPGASRARPG
jgi:hypothetical protein